MNFLGVQTELTNWSKSAHSPCLVYQVSDTAGIARALAAARDAHVCVLPHGAGHSYTDAALNTGGMVMDMTPMHRVLSWDAERGRMCVEPGVTVREMVQTAWKDGWWPSVTPSTPEVTMGGCAAMNVNGRNAWKCGPFGATMLSLDVLLPSGEMLTLTPERDGRLFHAFVGSMGLLGIITAITVQLQRISSGYVTQRKHSAASLDELFERLAQEEPDSDFLEAWLDGFAGGRQLGRGLVTSAVLRQASGAAPASSFPMRSMRSEPDRLEPALIHLAAGLGRMALQPGVQLANRVYYGWERWRQGTAGQQRGLFPATFWHPAAFAGYHTLFPEGVETFQAFIPGERAKELSRQLLCYTQQQGCLPLWCIIKRHRRDPFLLSYQVDGYSLELNYRRTARTAERLKRVLQYMIAAVIEAGGRFYLAKDHFLTHAQYRQSVGSEALDTFLELKRRFDPEMMLQSDLYRRVFQSEGGWGIQHR